MEKVNYYIRCIEEFWPGQREGIRTARIEIIDPDEPWPIEVGRITCDDPYFSWLYDKIENIRMKMSKSLLETLRAIDELQRKHDYSPSLKELAAELEISGSAVSLRIHKLIEHGDLKRFGNRALRITKKGRAVLEKE